MKAQHIGAILGALITLILPRLLFRKNAELPEAKPYQFEKDKALPNYNEVQQALNAWRQEIDNAKREGKDITVLRLAFGREINAKRLFNN